MVGVGVTKVKWVSDPKGPMLHSKTFVFHCKYNVEQQRVLNWGRSLRLACGEWIAKAKGGEPVRRLPQWSRQKIMVA